MDSRLVLRSTVLGSMVCEKARAAKVRRTNVSECIVADKKFSKDSVCLKQSQ